MVLVRKLQMWQEHGEISVLTMVYVARQ